jgi:hypothetical protein
MKDLGKFKLFGLLIFLSVVLVFAGVNFLEGKKPGNKPPKWDWKVGIPNLGEAESEGLNLYGNNPEYVNNDFVEVDSWMSEDKDTGEIHYTFSLKIENTEKGISNSAGDYSIGFRDIWFYGCKSYCFLGGEGPCLCWILPNSPYPAGVDCCYVDCSGPESPDYWVMKEFMETSAHPRDGYDHFSLRIIVYYDIGAMDIGSTVPNIDGYMWKLNIWNTEETMLEGNEDYHNIVCDYRFPLEGIEVKRSGENEWTIFVDQCGVNEGGSCPTELSGRYIVFHETYYQGIKKTKGKSGKEFIDSEYRKALGAATAFKFITKWTRY